VRTGNIEVVSQLPDAAVTGDMVLGAWEQFQLMRHYGQYGMHHYGQGGLSLWLPWLCKHIHKTPWKVIMPKLFEYLNSPRTRGDEWHAFVSKYVAHMPSGKRAVLAQQLLANKSKTPENLTGHERIQLMTWANETR
jgi:hypothetical protein